MCAYHRSDAHVRAPNRFQNSLSWGKQMRFTLMKLHAELELGSGSLGREGQAPQPPRKEDWESLWQPLGVG